MQTPRTYAPPTHSVHMLRPLTLVGYYNFIHKSVCYRYSCLIYVICICLRVLVSNTYCVVFFFVSRVYPILPVSLGCPFLIAPSVFSDVYYQTILAKLEFNLDYDF